MIWENYSAHLACDINAEYGIDLMRNTDNKFAFFKGGIQFSEEFDDLLGDVEEGGIFDECVCVTNNNLANYIYLPTGSTVIPYWCDEIDESGYITCGDFVGYVSDADGTGIMMEGAMSHVYWKFNWDNNQIVPNIYKDLYESQKANLTNDFNEIADYLYENNINMFNKFIKMQLLH